VVAVLSPDKAADLRDAPFTYAEVGATARVPCPGYHHLRRSRVLGETDFDTAVERLLTWQVHEGAGLQVAASPRRVDTGAVVELRLGIGRFGLRIPCRVAYVVDERDRAGFAYGTLPGHPEAGEELFLVERGAGEVRFTVSAFSRPATLLAKAGGPASRRVQQVMAERYLRAIGD